LITIVDTSVWSIALRWWRSPLARMSPSKASNTKKIPHAKGVKRQVTLRLDEATIQYFKQMVALTRMEAGG
jgi:hypothetical protein